jgi:hypothetical protein
LQIHDQLFDKGLFIGKDQTIMNILAFKSNCKIAKLIASRTNYIKQVDIWFFYQYYLASDKFYTCNNRREQTVDLFLNLELFYYK